MDHQAGQSVSVGLRQLTDVLIQLGETVAIILDFYKNINTSHVILMHIPVPHIKGLCDFNLRKTHRPLP